VHLSALYNKVRENAHREIPPLDEACDYLGT